MQLRHIDIANLTVSATFLPHLTHSETEKAE
jgi:hypothetical protein